MCACMRARARACMSENMHAVDPPPHHRGPRLRVQIRRRGACMSENMHAVDPPPHHRGPRLRVQIRRRGGGAPGHGRPRPLHSGGLRRALQLFFRMNGHSNPEYGRIGGISYIWRGQRVFTATAPKPITALNYTHYNDSSGAESGPRRRPTGGAGAGPRRPRPPRPCSRRRPGWRALHSLKTDAPCDDHGTSVLIFPRCHQAMPLILYTNSTGQITRKCGSDAQTANPPRRNRRTERGSHGRARRGRCSSRHRRSGRGGF
jgi:hypothetical protein